MTIRSLQHFALSVPNPDAGRKFYEDFGLETRKSNGAVVMRCYGRKQDQVILLEGKQKRFHHLCLGTKASEFEATKRSIERAGHRLVDPPREYEAEGLWVHDPDGRLVNVRVAAAAPARGGDLWRLNTPGHIARVGKRGYPPHDMKVRPRRLGHVLFFTPDIDRQIDFYVGALGMKLSDRAKDVVAFLRNEGASDHHVVAFLKSDRPGFHHASFEVGNIDEIGLGAERLLDAGYRNGWGLGRHVIGSNFFHYIRDPWMSLAEYFCDIDHIPAKGWKAKDWPLDDALYIWGPNVPDDFGKNFEAA